MQRILVLSLASGGAATLAALCVQITMPHWRRMFVERGIIDHPDGVRKLHHGAIPRAGGGAVMTGYIVAAAALFVLAQHLGLSPVPGAWLSVVPALLMIFIMGIADDVFSLRARFKLLVQVVAALIAVVPTAAFAVPGAPLWLTCFEALMAVFWLILATNAFNLIDGMDGLASGLAIVAATTVAAAALLNGATVVPLALAPLIGALGSFLRFNFHPASVFLGDSGSYSLGFLIGWSSLVCLRHQGTYSIWIVVPVLACMLPVLDVLLAVWRRFLRARPLFSPDRGHVHYRLLARGMSMRQAAMVLYAIAFLYAACALCLVALPPFEGVAALVAALLTISLVFILSYEEIAALCATLRRPTFRNAVAGELSLRAAETNMMAARTSHKRWEALEAACRDMGFCSVQMDGPRGAFESRPQVLPPGADCLRTRCAACMRACSLSVRLDDEGVILLYQQIERQPRVNAFLLAAMLQRGWSAQADVTVLTVNAPAKQVAHLQESTEEVI